MRPDPGCSGNNASRLSREKRCLGQSPERRMAEASAVELRLLWSCRAHAACEARETGRRPAQPRAPLRYSANDFPHAAIASVRGRYNSTWLHVAPHCSRRICVACDSSSSAWLLQG
ncbi:unnamed protein product [Lampetra fluviatilis]